MSTLLNRSECWEIQFKGLDGKKRSIRLGKVQQRLAESVRLRVDRILAARRFAEPLDAETRQWLIATSPDVFARLARAGLVTPRGVNSLGGLRDYILETHRGKPQTKLLVASSFKALVQFFGENRNLSAITPRDADLWRDWLSRECRLAETTVSQRCTFARAAFSECAAKHWIAENPFTHQRGYTFTNPATQRYVESATIMQVLPHCGRELRLVMALARWGGLRIPSEIRGLRVEDIRSDRILIHSPKTERYATKATRFVPITRTLRQELEAHGLPDEEFVFPLGWRRKEGPTIAKEALRAIRLAKITPWPRLFHNLRASCQTDLEAVAPTHAVCAWLGNSAPIAARHYLRVTDSMFAAANSAALVVEQKPGEIFAIGPLADCETKC